MKSQMNLRLRSTLVLLVLLVACNEASNGDREHAEHDEDHDGIVADELDDDFHGCPDGIPAFELGLQAAGEHVRLKLIAAMPAEPERYLNDWIVEVSALDGSPAPDALITRGETFMPVHGHDGRVQPQMKALAKPGQFQVNRLNFTMRGPWLVARPIRDQPWTPQMPATRRVC
jgi:hypothetical protein